MHAPRFARLSAIALLALAISASVAVATTVTLTVQEPAGVARIDDPITSGVPISTADTASSTRWALFDGTVEIPLQTTVLSGIRTPWLLLDFQSTLGASATKTYSLVSQPPTAVSPSRLQVSSSGAQSTIITGPLKVVIGTSPFNFIDELWLDRDHDTLWEPGEQLASPSTASNIAITAADNQVLTGRRTPLAVAWEDSGQMRATLRIDGYYAPAATPTDTVLRYTTRITFYAGKTYINVQHLIRNSFRANTKFVKAKSAVLQLGTPTSLARIPRSGDKLWLLPASGSGGVQLIPPTQTVTTSYSNGRTNVAIDVDTNGGMIIADESYHGATVRMDFADSTLAGSDSLSRAARFKDRLVALAPEAWYSERGAFGADYFSTYADEHAAYTSWGWAWPNTMESPNPPTTYIGCSNEHSLPRPSDSYYPSWSTLSSADDPESDNLWQHLLMFARTGQRTYLDRADRWARYDAWEFAWRTDGFAYEDSGSWSQYSLPRPRLDIPSGSFSALDESFIAFNCNWNGASEVATATGKEEGTHSWNGGLIDYYYMFGDRDALAAAADIAEHSKRMQEWRSTSDWDGSNLRGQARAYLNALRMWEATNSSLWRGAADKTKQMFLMSSYYDPRGFYFKPASQYSSGTGIPSRYPNGKVLSPFMQGLASHVLYRDWLLTNNDSLRVRAIALAEFAYNYGAHADSGFTGDYLIIDSPSYGGVLHHSTTIFRFGQAPWLPLSSVTNAFVDALSIGFRLTGNDCYITRAKQLWNRASKYDRQYHFADNAHVGRWMNSMGCWDPNLVYFPDDGDLTTMQYFFHDVASAVIDEAPPSTTTTLALALGYDMSAITWTAPGDDGPDGAATQYELRYAEFALTSSNFSQGTLIATNPPSTAGTPECVEYSYLAHCTHYYFALRTKDECGNWSSLSNVPHKTSKCTSGMDYACSALANRPAGDEEAEGRAPTVVEFMIASSIPSRGDVSIDLGIPVAHAGLQVQLGVFDIAGRTVRTIHRGIAEAGRFTLTWDRRTEAGTRAHPGAYFVGLRLGSELQVRKLLLVQ